MVQPLIVQAAPSAHRGDDDGGGGDGDGDGDVGDERDD